MKKIPAVDLMLFWGIIGTIGVSHSLLLTSGTPWESTTWFYIIMWISSMIILIFCRVLYKETPSQFDYDESLSYDKLIYVLGGLVAIIFVSSILVQGYTRSSIWVPIPSLSLTVGTISLSAVVNDVFFQLSLVCNSEETMVLSLGQVIRRKLTTSFSVKHGYFAPVLAIVIPRAGWAVLHAYVSYTGALMYVLVLSAFISGCVISYCAYNSRVRSFLVALLIHFGFNASIVLANAFGLL